MVDLPRSTFTPTLPPSYPCFTPMIFRGKMVFACAWVWDRWGLPNCLIRQAPGIWCIWFDSPFYMFSIYRFLGKIRDIFRVLVASLAWRSRGSWARQGSDYLAGYPAVAVVPASGFSAHQEAGQVNITLCYRTAPDSRYFS